MPYVGDPIKINNEKENKMTEYNENLESMSHSDLVAECRKLSNSITFVDGVWKQRFALEKEVYEALMMDYKCVLSMCVEATNLIHEIYDSMHTHKVMLPDAIATKLNDYMSEPF